MMLYLDDVCVIGRDEDDYVKNLETVFKRLSAKRITLNPRKCHLGLQEVEYVGHVLDATGVTFSPEKIVKVLDFVRPHSQQGLKKFVGLVNYFRTHIRNCSITMAPLNAMLTDYSKRKGLQWTPEADSAFHKLKADLAFCPKLFFDDWESEVVLETDASDKGVGAYLYQRRQSTSGKLSQYPVALLSQAFTDQQRRWHTAEKEAYAVFWAITKLRHLLLDRPFLIRTDHLNLTYIDTGTSDKIKRWKLALQEYQFKIEHVEGPKNIIADPLSRLIAVTVLSIPKDPTTDQALTLRLQTQRVTPPIEGVYFLGRGPADPSIPSPSESQAEDAAAEDVETETDSHSHDGQGRGASQPRRRERDRDIRHVHFSTTTRAEARANPSGVLPKATMTATPATAVRAEARADPADGSAAHFATRISADGPTAKACRGSAIANRPTAKARRGLARTSADGLTARAQRSSATSRAEPNQLYRYTPARHVYSSPHQRTLRRPQRNRRNGSRKCTIVWWGIMAWNARWTSCSVYSPRRASNPGRRCDSQPFDGASNATIVKWHRMSSRASWPHDTRLDRTGR